MKKLFVIAFAISSFSTAVYAGNKPTGINTIAIAQDDNKTKIDPAALPDAVKKTLASDAYKDWTAANAWVVTKEPVYYIVELKKDDKTVTLNIDRDGNIKS